MNSVDVTAPVVVASVAMSAAAVPSMAWSAASVVSTSAWAMSTVPEGVMVFAIVKATLVPDGMAFVAVVIVSVLAASLLHTAAPPTLAGEVKLMVGLASNSQPVWRLASGILMMILPPAATTPAFVKAAVAVCLVDGLSVAVVKLEVACTPAEIASVAMSAPVESAFPSSTTPALSRVVTKAVPAPTSPLGVTVSAMVNATGVAWSIVFVPVSVTVRTRLAPTHALVPVTPAGAVNAMVGASFAAKSQPVVTAAAAGMTMSILPPT